MTYTLTSEKIKKYVHNVDTSFTRQDIGTSIQPYGGTEVIYTPPSGSQGVVYECNLQFAWGFIGQNSPDESASYACTRLQYSDDNGGSWNTLNNTKVMDGTQASSDDYDWFIITHRFLIPTWSGERKLRLAGRAFNSNSECALGRAFGATEDTASCPHVTVYSIH